MKTKIQKHKNKNCTHIETKHRNKNSSNNPASKQTNK